MDDIASAAEARKKRDLGGNNSLLVHRYYFGKSIEIPSSGGRSSMKHKKDQ